MNAFRMSGLLIAAAFVLGTGPVWADVKMPDIFGDHMVLQQGIKVPVWGTAEAGEAIAVTVGAATAKTVAGADGKWRVDLPPLVGTAPVTMQVQGKNALKYDDVLIGDVWVCSGQSNMEFGMTRAHNAATELPKATDPQLRFFSVKKKVAFEPQSELSGKWMVSTPDAARGFTAVGYFFGRELRASLGHPIGLIGTYWGGTPAQAWTSLDALKQNPDFTGYVSGYEKAQTDYPKAKEEYPAKLAAYQAELKKWNEEVGNAYNKELADWKTADAAAKAAGQPSPPMPKPSQPIPKQLADPEGYPSTGSFLFNGMVAPIIPYAIKGVIWYQGEANVGNAIQYRSLFSTMITDWRARWGEGDFPFLFVQLAAFRGTATPETDRVETAQVPVLRESQLKTLSLPKTGMATAIDIGDPKDIHPTDKYDVGMRLAQVAKHVAYGQELVYSGPNYDKMEITGNSVHVTFTQTGGGLIIGTAPWRSGGSPEVPNTSLLGFFVAGADKKWFPADAKIDGNTVVVTSAKVPQPVAVRYAWQGYPVCNLYNKEGFPASSFRSDDWSTKPPMAPVPAPATVPTPAPSASPVTTPSPAK